MLARKLLRPSLRRTPSMGSTSHLSSLVDPTQTLCGAVVRGSLQRTLQLATGTLWSSSMGWKYACIRSDACGSKDWSKVGLQTALPQDQSSRREHCRQCMQGGDPDVLPRKCLYILMSNHDDDATFEAEFSNFGDNYGMWRK